MDIKAALDDFQAQFFGPERAHSLGKLGDIINHVIDSPADRQLALREIVARVDHDHVGFAAYLALAGGALVEGGEPAGPLGRALAVPLGRALVHGARMHGYVAHLPDVEEDEEDDNEEDEEDDNEEDDNEEDHDHDHNGQDHDHNGHDHDHEHAAADDGTRIGRKWVTRELLDQIADSDLAAVQAWFSLDMWYRPAVATWTRDPAVLREQQRDTGLREAIAALGATTETSYWLSLLIDTVFDARFVLLVPELGEAWSVMADGIVDLGQFSVLLSTALAQPLAKLGASDVADEDVLAVMRGDGPQQDSGTYRCSFYLYPPQTVDAQGMPRDNVYEWRAPGGTGSHSLPPDFLPGSLEVSDGARVLVLVGPGSPGTRFTRVIPAVRTFEALAASVSAATRLPADQAKRWADLARARAV